MGLKSLASSLNEHPYVKLIVAAATIIGGVATLIGVIHSNQGGGSPSRPPTSAGVAQTPLVSSGATSGAPRGVPAHFSIGTCLNGGHQSVSCDATHQSEIYAVSGPCDAKSLVQYMGGQYETDVLLSLVSPTTLNLDRAYCVVSTSGTQAASSTVRDALDSSRGDAWRRCLDNRFSRETACSDPHTDEFVFSGVLQPTEHLDCAARSTRYLGSALTAFGGQLTVRNAVQGNVQQCLVEVLGDNLLTRSVRRIGTATLPIEAAP